MEMGRITKDIRISYRLWGEGKVVVFCARTITLVCGGVSVELFVSDFFIPV